jgi:MFS family permease
LPADEHRSLIALLIVSAFVVSGGIHYQTPMLAAIAAEFQADAAATGWIPACAFGGMVVGTALLVPLGDRIDKRVLVLSMIVVLTLSQMVAAAAPSITVLAGASLLTGFCSPLLQNFVAIIAEIAPPNRRGRALGTQLTAMFSGILFRAHRGRIDGNARGLALRLRPVCRHAARHHRRAVGTAAQHASHLSGIVRRSDDVHVATPARARRHTARGGDTVHVRHLLRRLLGGGCTHAGRAPPVGPTGAGMIGIPGSAGILVARSAGRWTDRVGVMPVVLVGICSMLAAWIAMGVGAWFLAAWCWARYCSTAACARRWSPTRR